MKSIFALLTICLFSTSFFQAQISNMDFESTSAGTYTSSNAVNGWSVSSQLLSSCPRSSSWSTGSPKFAVLATPIASVPIIGSLAHSPLGGTHIVQLNNTSGTGYSTKLSRTFSVTSSNTIFQYAYAAIVEAGNHTCCDGAFFKVEVLNQSGVLQYCLSYTLSADNGCQSSGSSYSTTTNGAAFWTNWQTKYIDLSAFVNTNVSIEISTSDCTGPGHYGTAFFDAAISSQVQTPGLPSTGGPTPPPVYYCPGSNQALLEGPAGYSSYSWADGGGPLTGATSRTLSVFGPVLGSVYTLSFLSGSGCAFFTTYTIAYSQVSISALGSSSTCLGGGIGSATVLTAGSSSGYNYSWTNATNSVVSTSAVANDLIAGTYTVMVTSAGSTSATCGTSTAAVTINTGTPGLTSTLKNYCGNEAYLSLPTGTNYQWYSSNLSAISASLGGTSSSYTLSSPVNLSTITVGYTKNGCRDSLNYILVSTQPGTVVTLGNLLACPGSTNGSVTVSITPALNAPTGLNFFSVSSTGTTTAYSATINPTSVNTFSAANLSADGSYSIVAFDGICKYTKTFSISPYIFNFSVSPGSTTLCPNNNALGAVSFTSFPSANQYSYSWSPTIFLTGSSAQNVIISPTVSPGIVNTIVYTVVVTPTVINCPQSKTLAITTANPLTPTITAIPSICTNAGNYTINVNPGGGTFINGTSVGIDPLTGIFSPSLQPIGLNTFTYANSVGTCVAKSSGTFIVDSLPVISVSGNTILCEGQSSTLLASGANTFTWSNSQVSPFISVNPQAPTSYTVEGADANTNCSNSKTVTVNVVPYPLITVVGNTLLCPGESASLVAMGAFTYSWSNGTFTYLNVVSPNTSTTYSVIGISYLSSCSSTAAITVSPSDCNFVGLQERNLNEGVSVYPNPTTGKITIESSTDLNFLLHDSFGRLIAQGRTLDKKFTFDLNNYANGIYLLKIYSTRESKTIKVIKND